VFLLFLCHLKFACTIQKIVLPDENFSLFVPNEDEVKRFTVIADKATAFPYWAKVWPSAVALAIYIQNNPNLVAGKRVAELAAGLGLPTLVAARYAKEVWCSDISGDAIQLATKSAKLHLLKNIEFEVCNFKLLPADFFADVVLLSDINYDPDFFEALEKILKRLLHRGCTLILSTPQRLMAKPFLEKLSSFITIRHEEEITEAGQVTFVSLFVLRAVKG
jgi:methyltransferase-like protein 23